MTDQEDLKRQWRLSSIIREYFSDDNDAVVEAINASVGQKITVRTIQAWQIAPDKASHRRVPEWAMKALEDYIRLPGKELELKERATKMEGRRRQVKTDFEWSEEVRSNKAVQFATNEIERETYLGQLWRDAAGKNLGNMLAERFIAMEKEHSSISHAFGSFLRALDESSDILELKRKVDESIRANDLAKFHVKEARLAIERGSGEFSIGEGLPDKRN